MINRSKAYQDYVVFVDSKEALKRFGDYKELTDGTPAGCVVVMVAGVC
jgi:hypothetical protein